MHIRILETGEPPAPLNEQFGDYDQMMQRMLAPISPRLSFSATAAHRGEALPAVAEFDGLLITGSPAGVYEGHDWIAPCEALVRATADAGKPMVGICFGHQLMAKAFGGKVEKSDKGWGVGAHRYETKQTPGWMSPSVSSVACVVSHQDQVVDLPASAQIIAGSEFCPAGVIEYAHAPALSFQQHPEFPHDFADALMRLRRGRIPEDRVDAGLPTLKQKSDRELMAQWIANFFLQHER